MAPLMRPLPSEATTEDITNACPYKYRHYPTYYRRPRQLVKKTWIHASKNIIINTDSEEKTGQSRTGITSVADKVN